jgi:hypothetical protein
MPRRKKNIFGFGEKKVTYHRDVAKERRELRKHAIEERRYRQQVKALKAQEAALKAREERQEAALRAREEKQQEAREAKEERIRQAERRKADAADRKIEREMREAGYRNPAESGRQYRLAQAVLSGTAKLKGMSKAAAQEIVDRTPKKLRSAFMRQNPEDAAAELSEAWHGRPARMASDIIETVHYHGVLTELGQLQEIKVMVTDRKAQAIFFDAETMLCSSENGKQLYVVGGDQSLDLEALGITGEEAEKDCVLVGEVYSLTYITDKQHLGKADKTPGPYEHIMGEKGGRPPFLVYDSMNETVGFSGGTYVIDPTDYDGRYSAGIRN